MRLLIVEDDLQISDGLRLSLTRAGYAVDTVARARDAIEALTGGMFDLVVLDLGLPDGDGFRVLESMRGHRRRTPVLILTARDDVASRVRGLDAGADDYMVKPFEVTEFEARIRAVIRRAHAGAAGDLEMGRIVYRPAQRRVMLDGIPVDFSRRELGVLEALLMRSGRVVSKDQLQEHLCSWDEELSANAIEIYIHRIRKKLEGAGVGIRTVRGFGYILEGESAA